MAYFATRSEEGLLHEDSDETDDEVTTLPGDKSAKPFSRLRCLATPVAAGDPSRCAPYAKLSVKVIQAAELDPSLNEIADTTDPYAILYVDDVKQFTTDGKRCRTETKWNTTAPRWDEDFGDISIASPLSIFTIRVFDSDSVTQDDPLGFLDIRVGALPLNQEIEDWFQLYSCSDDQDGDTVKCRLKQCSSIQHPAYSGWIQISLKMTVEAELDVLFAYMLYPPYHGHGLKKLRLERMMEIGIDFSKKSKKIKSELLPFYEFIRKYITLTCGLTLAAMWIPFCWTPFCLLFTGFAGAYLDLVKPEAPESARGFAACSSETLGGRSKSTIEGRFATPKKGIQTMTLSSMNPFMPRGPRQALRTMQFMLETAKMISGRVENRVASAFKTISLPLIILQILLHFAWPYLFLFAKVAVSVLLVYCTVIGRVLHAIWMYCSHRRISIDSDTEQPSQMLRAESSLRVESPGDHRSYSKSARKSQPRVQPHHLGKGLKAQLLVVSSEALKDSERLTAHELQPLSFYSMTWCRVCAGVVVGLWSGGVECGRCEMVVCGRDSCKKLVKELKDCRGEVQPNPYYCNPHNRCWSPHRCWSTQALGSTEIL